MIFLFIAGIRTNENCGCYRRESVSGWGTYHFSGTWSINSHLSFSPLCFCSYVEFTHRIVLIGSSWHHLFSFNTFNLFNQVLTTWGRTSTYFVTYLFYCFSFCVIPSLDHLFFINGLCKASRGRSLKKLKLRVSLCNFS